MSLADDLTLIAAKIDELKALDENIQVHFSFSEISDGYDYNIKVMNIPGATTIQISSLVANDITDFIDNIINDL